MSFLSNPILIKFIKFCVVGFSGLIIDFTITFILKEKLKVQQYIANASGFIVAATANYYLNRIWTFRSHNPEITIEFSLFLIIAIIGLLINTFILWILVSKLKWNFYLSKLFAIGVVTLWNFTANFLYTFC